MKTNLKKIGATFLAVGICVWAGEALAQTTTTSVTTTNGAFTEFVPGSETVVLRSETNPEPLRYVVTKQTTIVDASGTPVAIEKISPGSPLSVEYATTGDRLVASRIVVQRPAASATTVTTEGGAAAPVTTRRTSTTTTRPLTHEEKEAREEAQEESKERAEEAIEERKEAVEKAAEKEEERLDDLKDKIDDQH
ncbi:MAG: hypothetical protein ABIR38_00735 [Chthoniobacterales bacterium]